MTVPSAKHILIPVDFSPDTDQVIRKIINLIEPFDSIIHFLHVLDPGSGSWGIFRNVSARDHLKQTPEVATEKLSNLKQTILKTFPHIKINTEVVRGKKVQKEIIEKANELHAELVVITKKATGKWFPFFNAVNATCIVKETKAAVLMVNPEAIPNKIKSVVFPVHSFVPNRNIELLSTLTGKHKATIHLATACCKEQNDVQTSVFVDTYRTLSDLLHYPLDYKVLNGDNFVKSVLSYGKKITADLVFVNTVEEAAFNSFYNADIGNMIPADAKQCIVISNIM